MNAERKMVIDENGRVFIAISDKDWKPVFAAWKDDDSKPMPMPEGHLMFQGIQPGGRYAPAWRTGDSCQSCVCCNMIAYMREKQSGKDGFHVWLMCPDCHDIFENVCKEYQIPTWVKEL